MVAQRPGYLRTALAVRPCNTPSQVCHSQKTNLLFCPESSWLAGSPPARTQGQVVLVNNRLARLRLACLPREVHCNFPNSVLRPGGLDRPKERVPEVQRKVRRGKLGWQCTLYQGAVAVRKRVL